MRRKETGPPVALTSVATSGSRVFMGKHLIGKQPPVLPGIETAHDTKDAAMRLGRAKGRATTLERRKRVEPVPTFAEFEREESRRGRR